MKQIAIAAIALAATLTVVTSCDSNVERTLYNGPEYIMFADTLTECYVTKTGVISVDVTSTVARDYDRTFGVEVVTKGSTAIENHHFNLLADNVTIKAGQLSTKVDIQSHFENFEPTDSLGVKLRLIAPENTKWGLYGDETKVVFEKYCDFNMDIWLENEKRASDPQKYNYANYLFYATFPYASSADQFTKILIKVEADPTNDHRLIIKDPFQKGLDLKITLIEGKPGEDYITMLPQFAFSSTDYGEITMTTTENASYYNTCLRYIELNLNAYKDAQGSFGVFPYYLEWITEYEAQEIRNNGF